jgi:hypothetical protein
MRGVLFDQPHVVDDVAADVEPDVAARLTIVGGSFFESVPEHGDAYLLKAVIHDWEDAEAVRILRAADGLRASALRCCSWNGSSASRTAIPR